jgi:hypothetical protein
MAVVALSTVVPGQTFSLTVQMETAALRYMNRTVNFILMGDPSVDAGYRVVFNQEIQKFQDMDETTLVTETELVADVQVGYVTETT